MNNTKLYRILILVLLVSNIVLASLLLKNSKRGAKPHMKRNPKAIIIKKLNLDDKQVVLYDSMVEAHREVMGPLREQINEQRITLFQHASDNAYNGDSMLNSIAILQEKLDSSFYYHFRDIRGILHEDQYPRYEKLQSEMSRIFTKGPRT